MNCGRISVGTWRKSPMGGPFAPVAQEPGRIANRSSNVKIERRPKADVDGEKIAEGKQRLKLFLAVFTTL
jgi:hypothetical protein